MSLLNDDQLQGLNDDTLSEFNASDSVSGEAIVPGTSIEPAVVVQSQEHDAETEKLLDTVGDYDTSLKTIEDDVVRTRSLKDVESLVLSAESIGQSMAEIVSRSLPALQEEVAPINRYTEIPTKTYLNRTKDFVETAVKSEQELMCDRLAKFITNELKSATALYQHVKNSTLESAIIGAEELRRQATLDLAEASVSKNFLRYRLDDKGNPQGSLLDLRHIPITQYLADDIPNLPMEFPSRVLRDAFYSAVSHFDIRSVVKNTNLASNLKRLVESQMRYGCVTEGSREERLPLTYMELLTLLSTNAIGDSLNTIANTVALLVDTVHVNGKITDDTSALVAEIATALTVEGSNKYEALEAFLSDVREMMGCVMLLVRFTTAVTSFLPIADEILRGYRIVMK